MYQPIRLLSSESIEIVNTGLGFKSGGKLSLVFSKFLNQIFENIIFHQKLYIKNFCFCLFDLYIYYPACYLSQPSINCPILELPVFLFIDSVSRCAVTICNRGKEDLSPLHCQSGSILITEVKDTIKGQRSERGRERERKIERERERILIGIG